VVPGRYAAARFYLVGEGENETDGRYFGIWDVRKPGPAMEKFSHDDSGWQQARKRMHKLNHNNPTVPLVRNVKCPTCEMQTVVKITGADKVATAALIGVFALGKISKSFKCISCGYSW
jgi:hypothetical protein